MQRMYYEVGLLVAKKRKEKGEKKKSYEKGVLAISSML